MRNGIPQTDHREDIREMGFMSFMDVFTKTACCMSYLTENG